MKATVANAFSEAIDAAVDTADAIAEGVGLNVERGDDFPESESEAKAASKRSLEKATAAAAATIGAGESDAEAAGDAGAGAGADVGARYAGANADVDAAADSPAPNDAADDLGWHRDVASTRVESNLDVQAVTSIARGARVELLLSSPEQHYGWEALDVILNLAATEKPQSVLSLSFGGLEKPHRGEDSAEADFTTRTGESGGGPSAWIRSHASSRSRRINL